MMNLILACQGTGVEDQASYAAASLVERLVDTPLPLVTIGGAIAVIAIISTTISRIAVARAREQTRREIAAYVAEGTLDPDKAIEMLKG